MASEGEGQLSVVAIETVGQAGKRKGRRFRDAKNGDPQNVPIVRATVIRSQPFDSVNEAEDWLKETCKNAALLDNDVVSAALMDLNRTLQAHRLAAGDPYLHEVGPGQAISIRIGYGYGAQLLEGKWQKARELDVAGHMGRKKRRQMLHPQQKVAEMLSGRRKSLLAEEFILRARLDLDMERWRAATLQADLALEALLAESDDLEDAALEDVNWLKERQRDLERIAESALAGELNESDATAISEIVGHMERVIRRRHYGQ